MFLVAVQRSPKILYNPIHCHQHVEQWPQSQKARKAFLCTEKKKKKEWHPYSSTTEDNSLSIQRVKTI